MGINKPQAMTVVEADKVREYLSETDRLIFDLSIETGLRIGDILKLRKCQIKKKMQIMESKTCKIRNVSITDDLYERLPKGDEWCMHYVFRSPKTHLKHLSRSTYHRHLKIALRASCVEIELSAHSARKLYAMNVFRATGDIFAVQKALNHKYVTTTCDYLDIDIKKLIGEVKPV